MKNLITCLVVGTLSCVATAQEPLNEDYKLLASDPSSNDEFGHSVAVTDDMIVVGAHGDDDNGSYSGSAYIYQFDGSAWIETKLLASDGANGDGFGGSVAIDSDTVVVSARDDDDNGSDSGSAYIYRFDGSSWIETKLLASDGSNSDWFGNSVAVSGDTVVVGAHGDYDAGSETGSAYIYQFDGSAWIETKLLPSDGASGDYFGYSVAISDDTVVVGTPYDDDNGTSSGSAYVYHFDGSSWIETKLIASDGASYDEFGYSVAADGDTVVVGARRDDDNGNDSGSMYIYQFDGTDWIETKLLISDGASYDEFGFSVAVSGDTVVVGARNDDDEGFADSGSAYIYQFDGSSWVETKLLASDLGGSDYFGFSVAVNGYGNVVVGAYRNDDNGSDSGSAYTFYGEVDHDFDGVPDDIDNCYLNNPNQADCNGNKVGDICDIADGTSYDINDNDIPDECEDADGDGSPDDIDNCYLYNPDQTDCNDNGVGDVCDVTDGTSWDCDQNNVPDECQPDCDGDGWIDPCDTEPDVDGDGIPDQCEEDCNGNTLPDHWEIEMDWVEDCNNNLIPDECDFADGTVEDCNLNGIPDSCDIMDGTEQDCNVNSVPDICEFQELFEDGPKLLASDGASYDYFGYSVAVSGDTVVVGAMDDDDNGTNSGSAYIYQFDGSAWIETKLTASDGASEDYYGHSVAIDGDRVVVGALHDDDNGASSGSAYVYHFDGKNWVETKLLPIDGADGDHFGSSVSIDGDNVIVGAPNLYDPDHGGWVGSAYIYRFDGIDWQQYQQFFGSEGNQNSFGHSVSISSDTVVVGARLDDINGIDSGSAYIYRFDGVDWNFETTLLASDGASSDEFGFSVAVSDSTVVVGADGDDDNGSQSGSVYIYQFDGSAWIETKLLASDGASGDYFGHEVAVSNDIIVVGAHDDDDNGNDSGSMYIYQFDGTDWIETKLQASDVSSDDNFGNSVAISASKVVVGAYMDDDNGDSSGSAYVFDSSVAVNDCNSNGILDSCDLEDPANDQNNNGVIDDCECVGDANIDGYVNVNDLLIVIGSWANNIPQGDLNLDGIVNVSDLLVVIDHWGTCP